MPKKADTPSVAAATEALWKMALSLGDQWTQRYQETLSRVAQQPNDLPKEVLRFAWSLGEDWFRYSQEALLEMARLAQESQTAMADQMESWRACEQALFDVLHEEPAAVRKP